MSVRLWPGLRAAMQFCAMISSLRPTERMRRRMRRLCALAIAAPVFVTSAVFLSTLLSPFTLTPLIAYLNR